MNKVRIRKLIKHLETLPEEQFDYTTWIKFPNLNETQSVERLEFAINNKQPIPAIHCGTVGCVAGHCISLFREECESIDGISNSAAELLGIEKYVKIWLFSFKVEKAKKSDAILRLKWLLEHGENFLDYPIEKESWY